MESQEEYLDLPDSGEPLSHPIKPGDPQRQGYLLTVLPTAGPKARSAVNGAAAVNDRKELKRARELRQGPTSQVGGWSDILPENHQACAVGTPGHGGGKPGRFLTVQSMARQLTEHPVVIPGLPRSEKCLDLHDSIHLRKHRQKKDRWRPLPWFPGRRLGIGTG